jgi:hypothetical protein
VWNAFTYLLRVQMYILTYIVLQHCKLDEALERSICIHRDFCFIWLLNFTYIKKNRFIIADPSRSLLLWKLRWIKNSKIKETEPQDNNSKGITTWHKDLLNAIKEINIIGDFLLSSFGERTIYLPFFLLVIQKNYCPS